MASFRRGRAADSPATRPARRGGCVRLRQLTHPVRLMGMGAMTRTAGRQDADLLSRRLPATRSPSVASSRSTTRTCAGSAAPSRATTSSPTRRSKRPRYRLAEARQGPRPRTTPPLARVGRGQGGQTAPLPQAQATRRGRTRCRRARTPGGVDPATDAAAWISTPHSRVWTPTTWPARHALGGWLRLQRTGPRDGHQPVGHP